MFKKTLRLVGRMDKTRTSVFHSPMFTLQIAKNNLLYNKYGFVVTKKIDKRAVVRNKIKRKMNVCVEEISKELQSGYDFLFFAKSAIVAKSKEEISLAIKTIFIKEGIMQ